MIPQIETHRAELAELCRRYHVRRLGLFGSAVTGAFRDESSDFDFLVEFEPLSPAAHADAYFGLLLALEDLLQRRIDLVEEGASDNPYFLQSVARSRMPLYAA
jgi:hypothetical protein